MDDNHFNEKLNMDELFKQRKISEEHKIKIYQRILARVHTKIKTTSRMRINKSKTNLLSSNDKFCFFLIPEFVLGIPRYNLVNCTSYIIEKLIDNGFMIKYTHPNLLFISWRHYIPHYERAQIKKKTGVSIDSWGNVVNKKDKKDTKDTKIDMNSLLLKNTPYSGNLKIKKKEDKKDYKQISTYKPTGNLIYNTKLLTRIANTVSDPK